MLKKILLLLATVPGILGILITMVAIRLTSGLDVSFMDGLIGFLTESNGMSGVDAVLDEDVGILYVLHLMNKYSHWIITGCIIWIFSILYIMESNRRVNRGKRKEK